MNRCQTMNQREIDGQDVIVYRDGVGFTTSVNGSTLPGLFADVETAFEAVSYDDVALSYLDPSTPATTADLDALE